MAVYLVYRTPYNQPNNKYLKKFEEDTVLAWFQNLWNYYDQDFYQFLDNVYEYIGIDIYGFWGPFRKYDEKGFDEKISHKHPPQDFKQIEEYLRRGYCNQVVLEENNYVQVFTDDDEMELAYYIFDDSYIEQNPIKTEYLIREAYELPTVHARDSTFHKFEHYTKELELHPNSHQTMCCFFENVSGDNISYKNHLLIKGLRLPELFDYLYNNYHPELILFRIFAHESWEQTLKRLADFKHHACFQGQDFYDAFSYPDIEKMKVEETYTYFLKAVETFKQKIGPERLGDFTASGNSRVQISPHLIQLSLNTDSWDEVPIVGSKPAHLFSHFIFFDDLWASKNETLAKSIMNYARGWDVL